MECVVHKHKHLLNSKTQNFGSSV